VLDEFIVSEVIGSKVPFDIVKGKHKPTPSPRIISVQEMGLRAKPLPEEFEKPLVKRGCSA
jgi:hypothetical protein